MDGTRTAATRAALANSLGAGGASSGASGHALPAQVITTVREAFVSALGTGLAIGAAVTLCGAVLAFTLVEKKLKPAAPPAAPARPVEHEAPELTPV